MKSIITFLFITQALLANAISIKKIPLNKLIDKSEFVFRGRVIDVFKTDSLLQQQLRNITKSKNYKYGDPNCRFCSETATFVITKTLKGQVATDTISIPFYSNLMVLLPGFAKDHEYILFLSHLDSFNLFVKSHPQSSAKSSNLNEYENIITEYLKLNSLPEKRKWIINLCVNPRLSDEGLENIKYSDPEKFTPGEKKIMTDGLLKMNFTNDNYLKLLAIIQGFGKNEELISKCYTRLESITENQLYEGLDLMKAIYEMNPKKEYKKLIDDFTDKLTSAFNDTQKLESIKEFISSREY